MLGPVKRHGNYGVQGMHPFLTPSLSRSLFTVHFFWNLRQICEVSLRLLQHYGCS
jgi:hypothetical protein